MNRSDKIKKEFSQKAKALIKKEIKIHPNTINGFFGSKIEALQKSRAFSVKLNKIYHELQEKHNMDLTSKEDDKIRDLIIKESRKVMLEYLKKNEFY